MITAQLFIYTYSCFTFTKRLSSMVSMRLEAKPHPPNNHLEQDIGLVY